MVSEVLVYTFTAICKGWVLSHTFLAVSHTQTVNISIQPNTNNCSVIWPDMNRTVTVLELVAYIYVIARQMDMNF